jgi:hypothetical protein
MKHRDFMGKLIEVDDVLVVTKHTRTSVALKLAQVLKISDKSIKVKNLKGEDEFIVYSTANCVKVEV